VPRASPVGSMMLGEALKSKASTWVDCWKMPYQVCISVWMRPRCSGWSKMRRRELVKVVRACAGVMVGVRARGMMAMVQARRLRLRSKVLGTNRKGTGGVEALGLVHVRLAGLGK